MEDILSEDICTPAPLFVCVYMEVKVESEKVGLKLNIQKTKIMASGPTTSWEIDVFLELSCFFYDPADVCNLISGSSAFSKTSLNIRKFTVHILLKPGLENFEHYFTSM